jgi:large subunit ribosomal protein L10
MSTARAQKEENAKQLREELSAAPHAILVDFKGLNVEWATDLRRKLRDGDASFKVVKNSTVLRAVEDLPLAELNEAFVGQTAIAYTAGDVVSLAKVLSEFAKDFETPSFKAGIVDGAPISAEDFEQLATLPPRDELIAKALYLMNYPLTGLATALNGILQGFVVVLDQIREKKEEAGEGEAAAPPPPAAAGEETATEEAAPAEEAAGASDADGAEETAAEGAEKAPAEEAAAEGGDEAPAEEVAAEAEEAAGEEDAAGAEEEAAAEEDDAAADEEAAAAEEEEEEEEEEAVEEPAAAAEEEEAPAEAAAADETAEEAQAEEASDDAGDEADEEEDK